MKPLANILVKTARRAALVAGGFYLLGFVGLVTPFAAMSYWHYWRGHVGLLPEHIGATRVLLRDTREVHFDGCAHFVYRLSPETAAALRRDGLAFLGEDMTTARHHPSNPYDPWRETPLVLEGHGASADLDGDGTAEHLLALYAAGGCTARAKRRRAWSGAPELRDFDAAGALRSPGNFYAFTRNRRSMILIDPSAGLAVFAFRG